MDSYTNSLESFRIFRVPLFRKPVTGQGLFFAVSYSKPALIPGVYALILYIHTFNASAWQGRLSSFKSFSLNGNDKELLRNATENTSKTWRSFCIAVTIFVFCFLFTDWVISRVYITTIFQSNTNTVYKLEQYVLSSCLQSCIFQVLYNLFVTSKNEFSNSLI